MGKSKDDICLEDMVQSSLLFNQLKIDGVDFNKQMDQAEKIINQMIHQGLLSKAEVYENLPETKKEQHKRWLKWKQLMYQNTKKYLENYHVKKEIEKEWIMELASEMDMPIPIDINLLKENVKEAIYFQRAGYEQLEAIIKRMSQIRAETKRFEQGLKILKKQKEGYYYNLIENAYILVGQRLSAPTQLENLKKRYEYEISKTTYYRHLQTSIEQLAYIQFGTDSTEDSLMSYIACMVCNAFD